jgi:hypothetical protein
MANNEGFVGNRMLKKGMADRESVTAFYSDDGIHLPPQRSHSA